MNTMMKTGYNAQHLSFGSVWVKERDIYKMANTVMNEHKFSGDENLGWATNTGAVHRVASTVTPFLSQVIIIDIIAGQWNIIQKSEERYSIKG